MNHLNNINWTDEQENFLNLNKTGKFVVKACPGSGKTTAVTERVYRFIKKWNSKKSGIAVLSFTNVAADEIKESCEENYGLKIEYPHFVGTLDSFINTYIFLPHGQLVMDCEGKPMLVGEPNGYWLSKDYVENLFDEVHFLINGEVTYPDYYNLNYSKAKNMKYRLTQKGFATQKDAIYHSMKVLEKYPKIAKAIALRFPHIIIDEAQDTSDIHMKIIDLLVENGLENVILVGDPEQSIYDWNGANPELFNEKYEKWDDSINFTYNFRSSQEICDFFAKLSNLDRITSKCNHDFDLNPSIIPHTLNYQTIINQFLEECKTNKIKISEDNVCVLFRGNEEIQTYKKSFKLRYLHKLFDYRCGLRNRTVNIINGLYHWNNDEKLEGFKIMEKEYLKQKYNASKITYEDIHREIDENGFQTHRKGVYDFIKSFPPFENSQTIDSWTQIVNMETPNELSEVWDKPIKNTPYHAKEITFELLFNDDDDNGSLKYHIGTVHSVKGCSLDATLLILKNNTIDETSYQEIISKNMNIDYTEELRVIYVALSRAKKLLHLAVPKNDYLMWKSVFS